ncbi:hypothetical protein J4573_18175 [Actinomadura barringtoniae]|uniref:DNA methylase N-4/N-6 domain-containing protein n=1 Tax=Actinomadura barringtoniae TaxID=1427535 RepID=A0A939PAG5_9ACTN|nr:hypothetical protein [Actinomadura barringtoniae]MBO2449036.1 hypothetical protein [Actinomadura barringtoniae]
MTGIDLATEGDDLNAHYDALAERWILTDRIADYSHLVTPSGNSNEPIHRWFHFKEGYSWALIPRLLKDSPSLPRDQLAILDPFLGSGTTLVSSLMLGREEGFSVRGLGIERNPAIYAIAVAKVNAALKGVSLLEAISSAENAFWKEYKRLIRRRQDLSTSSTTLNNLDYFDANHVHSLLALGRASRVIDEVDVRAIFQACVAAVVEPAGRVRRDGRALRYMSKKRVVDPQAAFKERLAKCVNDISCLPDPSRHATAEVLQDDARGVGAIAAGFDANLIVFSPPYPNNIDYTEVYKMEAWALELYADVDELKNQRLRTIRSHPSLRFSDDYAFMQNDFKNPVVSLISPILDSVPDDRYQRGRRQVISGYADDMLKVLCGLRNVAAVGSYCAIVVGNSIHGTGTQRFVIAADLILARLAELAGWRVEEIRVARLLRRRATDADHLRESVVVLRS